MLHRHAFQQPARRRPPLPRIADATPLSASGYLRLRRLAAGLTEYELAERMCALYAATATRHPGICLLDVTKAMSIVVGAVELPGAVARRPETIDALAALIPLDPAVYWQLAHGPAERHPRVCRGCGTSTHAQDMPSWATATSCTRCDPDGEGL
ncbi:hypothetical protein [Sphingomonas sp. 3-13AW]|uniref:hypothetical protein n=1 Tax=Sphingomonas sp. 3-13AW TaxID=3050450 RepID=UPI003BB5F323